jgi:4-nitrophenyl phosphatase
MGQIAGVVLAAGGSTRFGQPKQLLDWQGTPLVAHAADVALAADLDPVLIVLGAHAESVRAALNDRPVHPVMNWRWADGLSTSVQTGLAMLPPTVDGALFIQCDQPLLTPDLLRRLVDRHEEAAAPIVHPSIDGRRGTPALFARSLFPELAAVSGDEGGRSLIERHQDQVATVEVDDPDLLADVDTPDDYARLRERAEAASDQERLRDVRHLIVDMDGVLWHGSEGLPGLTMFFDFLRERGVDFTLATNNASKRPEQYVEKLASLGVEMPIDRIFTSAQATAAYLADVASPGAPVYVVGMDGIREALAEQGFELVDEGARYVVVGWTVDLTWQTLAAATLQIRAGAEFIGTNPDPTFPSEAGLVPGNGASLAALEAATGVEPQVVGKPSPWLFRQAMDRMGAKPETTAMVGDRLTTDIVGGINAGIMTILLLSGVTSEAELARSSIRPDLVYDDLEALMTAWKEVE